LLDWIRLQSKPSKENVMVQLIRNTSFACLPLALLVAAPACNADDTSGDGNTTSRASSSESSGGATVTPAGSGGAPSGSGGAIAYGDGGAPSGSGGAYGDSGANAGDACVSETLTTPADLPQKLVPVGSTLVHFLHARGTQTYECQENPVVDDAGPRTYDWGTSAHNATPEALVYDNCGVAKIHHFAGPTWEWISDGSSVKGTKVAAVPMAGTIPWLLLKASVVTPGILSDVTFVQRLETTGGAPPKAGCDQEHQGDKMSIPYTAGYYFYTGPAPSDGG
jgi:Protein of unknown function (DUF3455)